MLYLPDPREPPAETPRQAPPGDPTWEDVRTCALMLKQSGAPAGEIFERVVEMGVEPGLASRLMAALFPPPKKCARHGKGPRSASARKSDLQRLEEAYRGAFVEEVSRDDYGEEEATACRCDHCGQRVAAGLVQARIKSETELMGQVAQSRTIQVTLCPACAAQYDGTGNYLERALIYLGIGAVLIVGVSWLWQTFVR